MTLGRLFSPVINSPVFCYLAFLAPVNKCQRISMKLMESLCAISCRKGLSPYLKLTEGTHFSSKGSFK